MRGVYAPISSVITRKNSSFFPSLRRVMFTTGIALEEVKNNAKKVVVVVTEREKEALMSFVEGEKERERVRRPFVIFSIDKHLSVALIDSLSLFFFVSARWALGANGRNHSFPSLLLRQISHSYDGGRRRLFVVNCAKIYQVLQQFSALLSITYYGYKSRFVKRANKWHIISRDRKTKNKSHIRTHTHTLAWLESSSALSWAKERKK